MSQYRTVTVNLKSGARLTESIKTSSEFSGNYLLECHSAVVIQPVNPRKKKYRDYIGVVCNAHNSNNQVRIGFSQPRIFWAFVDVIDLIPYSVWKLSSGYIPITDVKRELRAEWSYKYCCDCKKLTTHLMNLCTQHK